MSPFYLGPVELDGQISQTVENAWQYSKVYRWHLNGDEIIQDYWLWRASGFGSPRANRYPAGRNQKPEFSILGTERLGYVDARKRIYVPLYANAVIKTKSYKRLTEMDNLVLFGFDGYSDYDSFSEALNNPHRSMDHSFVLAMLLTKDKALKECGIDVGNL